jgi:hypothetical protein
MNIIKVKAESFYPAIRINGDYQAVQTWKVKHVSISLFGIVLWSEKYLINLIRDNY